jgi:hypothetical protein
MVLIRFIVLLGVVLFSFTVGLSSSRQAEVQLPFDLLVSFSFVLFMVVLVLMWAVNSFRAVGAIPAMLGMTFMAVVTVILPEAIIWRAAESQQAVRESTATPTEPAPDASQLWYSFKDEEGKPVNAGWFYKPTTMPGYLRRLHYGGIAIWAILSALIFGWLATSRRPYDWVEVNVSRLLTVSRHVWFLIACIVLILVPIWVLKDFGELYYHISPREFFDPKDPLAETLIEIYKLVWLPFALAVIGLLSSRQLRAIAAPLLELGLDVLNYFPPIRRANREGTKRWSVDSWRWLRLALGGWQNPTERSAQDVLAIRLRNLLRLVHTRLLRTSRNGPVLVVAHSLGSVISLSALERPTASRPCKGPGELPDGLEVYLVTLGSPLALLATAYPKQYGTNQKAPWVMPSVRLWQNLYRSADVVGRAISQAVFIKAQTHGVVDKCLGQGTHANYYTDERLAKALMQFWPTLKSAGEAASPVRTN